MTRTVVLGASGYLGGEILRGLGDRASAGTVLAARDIDQLEAEHGPLKTGDLVINCVGYYGRDREQLWATNVLYARRVAIATARAGSRLVHLSSMAVFDGIVRGRIDELTPPTPRSSYGKSKLAGERAVLEAGSNVVVARPAKVFGGADPRGRLQTLVRYFADGKPLPIPDRPRLWANFVWVSDIVEVLVSCAAEADDGAVVHLATPRPWGDFVALLADVTGRSVRPAPRSLEACARAAVPLVRTLPRPPRRLERIVELWDERVFVDQHRRFPEDSLLNGLRDLMSAVG
ncbi:MAG: sugar nucleotide-binding protein [Solirubrobacterales bacterium]